MKYDQCDRFFKIEWYQARTAPGNIITITATAIDGNLVLVESTADLHIDHVNFEYLSLVLLKHAQQSATHVFKS